MRSPVQSFPVDVHDIYEDARASMKTSRRSNWPKVGVWTALAICCGAALGFYLAIGHGTWPAARETAAASTGTGDPIETTAAPADRAVETAGAPLDRAAETNASPVASAVETSVSAVGGAAERPAGTGLGRLLGTVAQSLRLDEAEQTPVQPLAANAWPITLHRAGDGRFYADLSLDGHIINSLIDPSRAHSTLRTSDLPSNTGRKSGYWRVSDVVLEHVRLPATRFSLNPDPAAETVIGRDLLAPLFTIEELTDRLRLVPRTG